MDQFRLAVAWLTGSRHGITSFQRENLLRVLAELCPARLHHGDCTGADAEAHCLCRGLGIPVTVHPPLSPRFRAFCDPGPDGEMRNPAPYLARNRAIVHWSSFLIALPSGSRPENGTAGSGTWTTVRYAEEAGTWAVILYPGGRVEVDGTQVAW